MPISFSGGSASGVVVWGDITGTLSDQTDLQAALDAKEPAFSVLPIAKGGTNSGTALNNNRIMKSAAGAIIEAAAITVARALISDGNGIPTHSAVTSAELLYLSGVTSALQAQLDAKVAKAGDTMTGALTLNADPTNALHAATKQYVDSVAAGLDHKASVLVGTTANITLSGEQTIDGQLTSASRVLVKNQTAPAENGIYLTGAGAWTRTTDMDSWLEIPSAFTFIEHGSTQADTGWVCTSNAGGTLNTTAITWTQFSGAGSYTADGLGIYLTGTQFSLGLDGTTLAKSGSGLKVNVIADAQIAAAAGILRNKLAALTVSRALVTDSSGFDAVSVTTAAEVAFLSGVTSAIQTQLNSKQDLDAGLTALAAFNTNGLLVQTANNTFAGRTLQNGGGISWTNPAGTAGDPTPGVNVLQTAWIPATAMLPSATGGSSALVNIATSANHPDATSLNFDATTQEYAQAYVALPKSWDNGTVTAQFYWSHAATATNFGVRWGLQGLAVSDDDTIDAAFGTAQEVTDTGGTTDDLYVSPVTAAITLAGTPASGDAAFLRLYRDPTNGADTMAVDARLHGVKLFYTINTLDDT